jgi:hypothetical protein
MTQFYVQVVYILGPFDQLKNKGLDRTTLVVLYLILKLFLVPDKLRAKGHDKN